MQFTLTVSLPRYRSYRMVFISSLMTPEAVSVLCTVTTIGLQTDGYRTLFQADMDLLWRMRR